MGDTNMTRLFIYGSLKKGYWNNTRFMTTSAYVGEAETIPLFRLFDVCGYPWLVLDMENGVAVKGELWDVEPSVLAALDLMEINAGYIRIAVKLEDGSIADTYMYVGNSLRYIKAAYPPESDKGALWEGRLDANNQIEDLDPDELDEDDMPEFTEDEIPHAIM